MTDPVVAPSEQVTPDQVNAIVAFVQSLIAGKNIRQDFNPKTAQFWTMIATVAGIIVAWLNPSGDLSSASQTAITAVGGIVVAIFAHTATTKVSVSNLQKLLNQIPAAHKSIVAKAFSPVILNPSPAGQVSSEGYYAPGTHTGSVLAPNAVVVVPPPSGGSTGIGGVSEGFTDEGNVSPNVTINVQTGPWAPGTHESNVPLGTGTGTNSAEGTGGPVISQQQGGLGVGGSVEAPGGYVPPAPNAPNPDEANPTEFVAKAQPPRKEAPHRKST